MTETALQAYNDGSHSPGYESVPTVPFQNWEFTVSLKWMVKTMRGISSLTDKSSSGKKTKVNS